jgi:hypothetical protein
LDVAKGRLARAARCKRPPGSQFGRKRQGGALGGRGCLCLGGWGGKQNTSKFATDPRRSARGASQRASPGALGKFESSPARWGLELELEKSEGDE